MNYLIVKIIVMVGFVAFGSYIIYQTSEQMITEFSNVDCNEKSNEPETKFSSIDQCEKFYNAGLQTAHQSRYMLVALPVMIGVFMLVFFLKSRPDNPHGLDPKDRTFPKGYGK